MNCTKCGQKTVKDHGIETCLSCGTEVVSTIERRKFIKANAPGILQDSKELGQKKTCAKWRISTSTFQKLKHLSKGAAAPQVPAPAADPRRNGLPPLPEFDKSWETEVQLRWLNIWGESYSRTK